MEKFIAGYGAGWAALVSVTVLLVCTLPLKSVNAVVGEAGTSMTVGIELKIIQHCRVDVQAGDLGAASVEPLSGQEEDALVISSNQPVQIILEESPGHRIELNESGPEKTPEALYQGVAGTDTSQVFYGEIQAKTQIITICPRP